MTSDRRAEFRRFAQLQEAQASPFYSHLAARIADDPRGYDEFFAAIPAHEQAPNMLFAAVQLRMLAEPETPLASYYASLHASPRPPDAHAYSLFREYCDAHREVLFSILRERRTQTNEVRRGLALWPAGTLAVTIAKDTPLALVEIGCSAGLNLIWDRYSYRYRDDTSAEYNAGNANSSLQMDAELRGPLIPPLVASPPRISQRIGYRPATPRYPFLPRYRLVGGVDLARALRPLRIPAASHRHCPRHFAQSAARRRA